MDTIDFAPATTALARVVAAVRDDQLGDPTPCPKYSVADLLDHIDGFPVAFTAAARKERLPGHAGPSGEGSRLEPGFRERIAGSLDELAGAWRDPAAYEGMTQAGPVELPGNVAALVALDEVVVHGWDLAKATGQPYDPDENAVLACLGFAQSFEPPAEGSGNGLYGPPVPVADDARSLDRLAGATGRDPHWTPPAA
jgi:uncharacterized protein (TIGR03086 family)